MYTIEATRLGFSYQDKFACLRFLEELRKGRLDKIYTDFPYETQHSVDIRLLLKQSKTATEEHVYEIKTGNKFKKDTKKKNTSEIRDAVLECINYQKIVPEAEGHICFSQGSFIKTILYTKNIDLVRAEPRMTANTIAAATWLKRELRITDFATLQEVVAFFGKCRLKELEYTNPETWSKLDDAIYEHINHIGLDLNAGSSDELPNHYLIGRLLHTIQQYAGTGKDIAEFLVEDIAEFFGKRQLLDKYSAIRDKMNFMQDAAAANKQSIFDNYGYGEPETIPEMSLSATTGELRI
jgi:hypothetical protein